MKNFAGIEIRTHNLLTDVVLLQPFDRSTSNFTSWASSDSQNSGGPGSHYRYLCGHLQTVTEPVHSHRVAPKWIHLQLPGLPTEARLFPETAFGGIWRGKAGWGKNSSGVKINFFLAEAAPVVKNLGVCLANYPWRGIRMTFSLPWQGICTLRQEFVHFGGICPCGTV